MSYPPPIPPLNRRETEQFLARLKRFSLTPEQKRRYEETWKRMLDMEREQG